MSPTACEACLRRAWLLSALAGHLNRARGRVAELLELSDEDLVAALAGRRRAGLARDLATFDPAPSRTRARRAGVTLICRCDPSYPRRLGDLPAPPAVLHVAGDFERFLHAAAGEPAAVVGTRRPSTYGL